MRIESELIPGIIASIQRDCKREKKPEGIITVTERNMKILELYKEGLTLEELGRLFGVTRERARQIAEQTIRRLAHNEAFSKGIELDFDIILQEERKKRGLVKNQKKTIVPKKTKEKTWSRYYLACQSCGTRAIPHRKKGLCQKCTGQYGSKLREGVICRNLNRCGSCSIVRSEAIRLYGRDLYITKNESVLCKKCFLSITGKKLGSRLRK